MQPVSETDSFQQLDRSCAIRAFATEAHPEQHVFEGREGGEQVKRLKDVADPFRTKAVSRRFGQLDEVRAANQHFAPISRCDSGDDVQQRRLPTATRSDEHDLLTRRQLEMIHVKNGEPTAPRFTISLRHVPQFKRHLGSFLSHLDGTFRTRQANHERPRCQTATTPRSTTIHCGALARKCSW